MHPSAPDPLSAMLHRADPAGSARAASEADHAAFAAGVHARLAANHAATPAAVLVFPTWLTRHAMPLAAALALLAALAAGGGLAYAREQKIRSEAFAAAYARSIDPWLMHAAQSVAPLATLAGDSDTRR